MLDSFGLKYRFNDERGECNKANIKKLLAIALYKSQSSYPKVKKLLLECIKVFKKMNVLHGVATCSLCLAYFMFSMPLKFIDSDHRSKQIILDEAMNCCNNALKIYKFINHNIGQAISFKFINDLHKLHIDQLQIKGDQFSK